MNLHILAYCLQTVLGCCLFLLCWSFFLLAYQPGVPKKILQSNGCTLQIFGAHGKAMTMPLGMVSSIYRAVRNVFFLSTVINCPRLLCCSEVQASATATTSLLWLPEINVCTQLCFISSLSSMCVYSRVFLMDLFPTNTWEDWQLKGCLDFLSNVVMSLAILSHSKNCCPLCLKAWGCWGTSDLLMASFQLPPHLKKI